MPWVETITGMPLAHYWAFTGFSALASGAAFWGGFRGLRRARLIEDVPTAKVRSAHQGYVELIGEAVAMQGEPIIAPLSGVQCCWYSYKVERRKDKSWSVVEKGESDGLFLIRDDSGDCVIDPEGATVTSRHKDSWYGSRTPPAGHGPAAVAYRSPSLLQRLNLRTGFNIEVSNTSMGRYRYTEAVILSGDPLYVIGHFKSLDDIDHRHHRKELTLELLREWKRDPEKMASFDRDGDGRIDMDEWTEAQRAAKQQAGREYMELMANTHLHTVSRPMVGKRPFLIANLPQFDLVQRYRLQGWLGLGFFLLAGAVAVYLLSSRFLA